MKKVLIFGTFDILHKGHIYLIEKASELGEVHVVIARDETVLKVKGKSSLNDENYRLEKVCSLSIVKKCYLGNLGDKYKIVEEIAPDIILLGYDQNIFTKRLEESLLKRGVKCDIVRCDSYFPDKYKSSLIREKKLLNNKVTNLK
ncbi:MAG: adenylyltransferase/cytidyltransferase family protein [Candidatus Woesearchaeota archaeon]